MTEWLADWLSSGSIKKGKHLLESTRFVWDKSVSFYIKFLVIALVLSNEVLIYVLINIIMSDWNMYC